MANVWCREDLPAAGIARLHGPSWSLTDRFSPPQTLCGGTLMLSDGAPQLIVAQASEYSALPPLQWLRSRPITRPSMVNLAFLILGLSKVISKHWSRSKVMVA